MISLAECREYYRNKRAAVSADQWEAAGKGAVYEAASHSKREEMLSRRIDHDKLRIQNEQGY